MEAGAGGMPEVVDACPSDPAKTAPGLCGCGFPDTDTQTLASCKGLKTALVHRYDFEGTGTAVLDRVGKAPGVVKGGAMLSQENGKGVLTLTGGAQASYVDLPNGIVSVLKSATFEAWVAWAGGEAWQRIFDFGDTTASMPEDNPANGKTYLFVTPLVPNGGLRAVYSTNGIASGAEIRVDAAAALPQTLKQVVVVVDSAGAELRVYVDGASVGKAAFSGSLSAINDVNVWLGRSQYSTDPAFAGTFHDFRIYNVALSPQQIATSFAGGPDAAFLAP